MIAVLIVLNAANKKNRMKTILKQDSNSMQRQNIVPVSNLKASKIKTLLSLPIHLAHHRFTAASVPMLLLLCCSTVAPLPLPLLLLLLPLLPLLIYLLLSLRCCSCCSSASTPSVTPLSLRCRLCCSAAAAVDPAVATLSLLLSLLLSLHCHS